MTLNNYLLAITLFVLGFVVWANPTGTIIETAKGPILVFLAINCINIFINKFFNNPFLELLNLSMVIFFILRIPFYYNEDVLSDLIIRSADLNKVNGAMITLNIQLTIFTITTLLLSPKLKPSLLRFKVDYQWKTVLKFTFSVLIINCIYLFLFFKLGENSLPNVLAIFFAIFNYSSIMFYLLPIVILNKIKFRDKLFVYLQLALIVFLVMFTGSKSGLLQVLQIFIIAAITIKGANGVKISLKSFLILLIIGAISVVFFIVGMVSNQVNRGLVDVKDMGSLVLEYNDKISLVLNAVSYRIGYLDFYLDKSIQEIYFSAFKIESYVKAIIDAVTPGINFFDEPLVSRSVYNKFFGDSEGPNSEAVTIFAEANHLMGYFSFFVYAFIYFIIRLFARINTSNTFKNLIYSFFVLFIFFKYLLGFGIDYWIFGDVLYPYLFIIVSLFLIEYFEKKFNRNNKIITAT